jgi:hypothetical protein
MKAWMQSATALRPRRWSTPSATRPASGVGCRSVSTTRRSGWMTRQGRTGLRGPVIGRRNHFGPKSARTTVVAATMYSLAESAEAAGVNPIAHFVAIATRPKRNPGTVLLCNGLQGCGVARREWSVWSVQTPHHQAKVEASAGPGRQVQVRSVPSICHEAMHPDGYLRPPEPEPPSGSWQPSLPPSESGAQAGEKPIAPVPLSPLSVALQPLLTITAKIVVSRAPTRRAFIILIPSTSRSKQ